MKSALNGKSAYTQVMSWTPSLPASRTASTLPSLSLRPFETDAAFATLCTQMHGLVAEKPRARGDAFPLPLQPPVLISFLLLCALDGMGRHLCPGRTKLPVTLIVYPSRYR